MTMGGLLARELGMGLTNHHHKKISISEKYQ
jgi:hypothetical protein